MAYCKDLSYLTSKDGTKIKPMRLIKSSRVSKKKSRELGIKKIIDLRTKTEVKVHPDRYDESVEYKNIPMFDMRVTGITFEKNTLINQLNDIRTIEETYREMVTNPKYVSNISKIIKEIINSKEFPIMYHCSQGKDRTGITTYVLLSLLGFDEETIIQDYTSIKDMNKIKSYVCFLAVLILKRDIKVAHKFKDFLLADEKFISCAIDTINETYGSIENFINNELGITKTEVATFKNKVLVKGNK